jgi:hypothetical protein
MIFPASAIVNSDGNAVPRFVGVRENALSGWLFSWGNGKKRDLSALAVNSCHG